MKNLTLQLRLASLLSLILLACTAAFGQLTPSGDSYTNTAATTTNYGAQKLLDVESSQTTFIQFDLSAIPAGYTSADITKASLKLYVNAVTAAGSFNVDYVNGTWTESTIDASNAPALGTTIAASVPLITKDKNQYIQVDVTTAVQAWLSGTANDGIALVANSPLNASFDSKENTTTSHPAELDIVFAGGGTLTGITTASGSGLTGGGTSGTLNLALTSACAKNQVLQYNGTSWVCAAVGTGTVTSVGSGTGLTGGPITGSGTLSIAANACASGNALSALPFTCSPFATLGANTFTGVQTINSGINITSGSLSATLGVAGGNAIIGTETDTTATSIGVRGNSGSPTGYGVYGNNTASTGPAPGVFGTTNSLAGYGVEGSGAYAGVYGTGPNYGVYGSTTSSTGIAGFFTVNSGGTILQGINNGNGATEFKVDSAGNVSAAGAVSGSSFQIGPNLFAFGSKAGSNAFLGFAGSPNTNATVNFDTAVGPIALANDTAGQNTAVGYAALGENTTGILNTGIGAGAGQTVDLTALTGINNTALGNSARLSTGTLNNATAIGAGATVSESNALVLGSDANVGIGTSAPTAALDVVGNSLQALIGDPGCGSGFAGIGFVNKGGFNSCTNYALLGDTPGNLYINSSLSGTIYFRNNNGTLMTIDTSGDVHIKGNLSKGGGSFKIDDPLDPANKYLYHSFVESPDMMNVYNGNITTNKAGLATVVLPDYFEALNRDFRYQLTVIGQFAQAIVAKEVSKGRFTIQTNRPGVKVSWQVTGIRQDAYANAHRIPTEVEKPPQEQGHYLHPELFGVGPEQAVGYDGSQSPAAALGGPTPTGGSRP